MSIYKVMKQKVGSRYFYNRMFQITSRNGAGYVFTSTADEDESIKKSSDYRDGSVIEVSFDDFMKGQPAKVIEYVPQENVFTHMFSKEEMEKIAQLPQECLTLIRDNALALTEEYLHTGNTEAKEDHSIKPAVQQTSKYSFTKDDIVNLKRKFEAKPLFEEIGEPFNSDESLTLMKKVLMDKLSEAEVSQGSTA